MLTIKKMGKYVPNNVYTNERLSTFIDTSDEWITTRTGIKQRQFAIGENTSDMATKAALSMEVNLDDVDLIVVGTTTPDNATPQVSNLVQAKLGLNAKEIMCLDINSACTGFIYALEVARSVLLTKKSFKKALIIGAETLSKIVDFTDRNTCVLFGDGAACALIEKGGDGEIFEGFLSSEGDIDGKLKATNPEVISIERNERTERTNVKMLGTEVFKFACKAIEKSVRKVLELNNMTIDDIDLIIPHQANIRIIEKAADLLKLDMSRFYVNLDKYGNTSAASIPLALYDATHDGSAKPGDKVLVVGFGGGLSYGASIIKL